MLIRLLLILFTLLLPARTAEGQAPDSLHLHPGDQIRLAGPLATDDAWVSGRVVEVWAHGFAFTLEGQPDRRISREFLTIDTIDVAYRSAGESARGGGILGGFVGASLGLLAGALFASNLSLDTGTSMALAGAGGGLLGGLAGALAGAGLSPLRWHRYVFQGTAVGAGVNDPIGSCSPGGATC